LGRNVHSVAYAPCGQRIAAACGDGHLFLIGAEIEAAVCQVALPAC